MCHQYGHYGLLWVAMGHYGLLWATIWQLWATTVGCMDWLLRATTVGCYGHYWPLLQAAMQHYEHNGQPLFSNHNLLCTTTVGHDGLLWGSAIGCYAALWITMCHNYGLLWVTIGHYKLLWAAMDNNLANMGHHYRLV